MIPALTGSPPASRIPWASAAAIQGHDSRVSIPRQIRGGAASPCGPCSSDATTARPRR